MGEDSLNRIIEKLLHETIPRTIQLRVSIEQNQSGSSDKKSLVQLYAETAPGERFFDQRLIGPTNRVFHTSSYCDAKKCANVSYSMEEPDSQSRVTVGHGFMNEANFGYRDAPEPFRFYHVGLKPIHEAIAVAEPMGQERVIGRACNIFHFRDVGPSDRKQSLVYALDEATSVPLRVAAYADPKQIRDQVPNWVWVAATLDEVSDRHYPKSSTYASFKVTQTQSGQWIATPKLSQVINVSEVVFDAAIPKSTFWPVIQPGVLVLDSIAKRKIQTPGGELSTQKASSAEPPIRVAPESGSWLPGIGAGLSLALLSAATVLWMRSRSRT